MESKLSVNTNEIAIDIQLHEIKENLKAQDFKKLILQVNFSEWSIKQLLELKEAIKNSFIEEIDFEHCYIGYCSEAQIEALFKDLLKENIHTLNLANNFVNFRAISTSSAFAPTLNFVLNNLLNTSLINLNLSSNLINTPNYSAMLASFLEHSSIKFLNLSENAVNVEWCQETFKSLSKSTLQGLNLTRNFALFQENFFIDEIFSFVENSNINRLTLELDLREMNAKAIEKLFLKLNNFKVSKLELDCDKSFLNPFIEKMNIHKGTPEGDKYENNIRRLTQLQWLPKQIKALCNAIKTVCLTSLNLNGCSYNFKTWNNEDFQNLIDAIKENPYLLELIPDIDVDEERKQLIKSTLDNNLAIANSKVNTFNCIIKHYFPQVLEDITTQYWLNDKESNLILNYHSSQKSLSSSSSSSSSSEQVIQDNSSSSSWASSSSSLNDQISFPAITSGHS